jgi:hypothetical protein
VTQVIWEADVVSSTAQPPEQTPSEQTPSEHAPAELTARDDGPPRGPRPTSVRVAVIVMSLLAGLLLVYVVTTWMARDNVIDQLVEDGSIARADGPRLLASQLIPFLVLGLILGASAWFLPRRQAWARWLGLAAVVVVGLLSLLSILLSGAISVLALLLLVLSIAAITSLAARTTGAWVPRLRGNR